MSLRKISDLEGLNIFERMRDNENPQLSSDMLNSLFEISYLTSKVDENTRYYRWTQHSGLAAKMYEKSGFRYINKSS